MIYEPFDIALAIEKWLIAERIDAHKITAHELIMRMLEDVD